MICFVKFLTFYSSVFPYMVNCSKPNKYYKDYHAPFGKRGDGAADH